MDISVDASQVEWTRESDLLEEDLLWNIEHAENANTVDITPLDMPTNWYEAKKVVFRCKISIPVSYTHLTLPTNREVLILVVAASLTKKTSRTVRES